MSWLTSEISVKQRPVNIGERAKKRVCTSLSRELWFPDGDNFSGIPGWQRITVALIIDGLEPMDKSVLDILAVRFIIRIPFS